MKNLNRVGTRNYVISITVGSDSTFNDDTVQNYKQQNGKTISYKIR